MRTLTSISHMMDLSEDLRDLQEPPDFRDQQVVRVRQELLDLVPRVFLV